MMLCENNNYCITTNMLAKLIFQVTQTKIRTFSGFLQEQYQISGLLRLIFFFIFQYLSGLCRTNGDPAEVK